MKIFVPYHISGLWVPIKRGSFVDTGSLGVGIVLESGVELARCPTSCVELDPTSRIAASIYGVRSDVLEGYHLREAHGLSEGYGASAARTLAVAVALEIDRGLGSLCRAGEAAHIAEVAMGTGLGDVIAEFYGGGLVVRTEPGAPCRGRVDAYPIRRYCIVTVVLRRWSTVDMLRSLWNRMTVAGRRLYEEFLSRPGIDTFLELAHRYSRELGFLTKELDDALRNALGRYLARGDVLGYFVKKALLVIVVEPSTCSEIASVLERCLGFKPSIDWVGYRGVVVEL